MPSDTNDDVYLLTIRVRIDKAFPATRFFSLRRYRIDGSEDPDRQAEVSTVAEAVGLTERWLAEIPPPD